MKKWNANGPISEKSVALQACRQRLRPSLWGQPAGWESEPGEMIYYDILNRAERYVHIMTPYLILDNEMITALSFAAKRGVESAGLLVPHIPDKEYALCAGKNLLQAADSGQCGDSMNICPGFCAC